MQSSQTETLLQDKVVARVRQRKGISPERRVSSQSTLRVESKVQMAFPDRGHPRIFHTSPRFLCYSTYPLSFMRISLS